jgi:hypothetical protein
MTEDEAKTKWCPQARLASSGGSVNRYHVGGMGGGVVSGSNCIASACMAWRETSSQHGYCGLAGRPRA